MRVSRIAARTTVGKFQIPINGKLAWDIEHPMIVPMLQVLSGDYHYGQALPGV